MCDIFLGCQNCTSITNLLILFRVKENKICTMSVQIMQCCQLWLFLKLFKTAIAGNTEIYREDTNENVNCKNLKNAKVVSYSKVHCTQAVDESEE